MHKKWMAAVLTIVLLLAGAVPAFAAEAGSEKEEVVYGGLGDAGEVRDIYVVNIFEGQKSIVDYGDYQSVRNMTSTDKIHRKGDQIAINTEDETLYYQGNIKEGELPWNIKLTYFLNEKEIRADQLAGRSGNLKIRIHVTRNQKAEKTFFENYALQITAVLNTEKCEMIKAGGATEANSGGNKQLTWTLLPGTEKTVEATAKVRDFEMDSLSFNGVRMDLDVDVDSSEMEEKFDRLSAAAAAIHSGAKNISSGAAELEKGSKKLKQGTNTLTKNIKSLEKKAKKAEKLGTASTEIKGATETLSQGISQLKSGISYRAFKETMRQNGVDLQQLKEGNVQMLQVVSELEANYGAMMSEEQKAQTAQAKKLLQGNTAAISGMEQYLDGASKELDAADKGAKKLKENYQGFDQGVQTLVKQFGDLDLSQVDQLTKGAGALADGSSELSEGSRELTDGTGTLKEKTSGLSGQAAQIIDEMLNTLSGKSEHVKSFVSEKNSNIKAVQFVIKNDPIEMPEEEPPAEKAEKNLSLWNKLVNLF